MGQIKRNIPANSDQSVAAQGNVVYIVQASAGFTLEIGSERFDVQQGDKLQVAGGYTSLRLINSSAAAVDVELVATNGDFHRSQIASAVTIQSSVPIPVNIAAQSLSQAPDLRAGRTFIAAGYINGANVTSYPTRLYNLIHNPAGSGIYLLAPKIYSSLSSPSAGHWTINAYLSSMTPATLQGLLSNTTLVNGNNKNPGSANQAACQMVMGESPDPTATTTSTNYGTSSSNKSYQPLTYLFEDGGVLIGPGEGILYNILLSTQQGYLNQKIEWIEEPIQ